MAAWRRSLSTETRLRGLPRVLFIASPSGDYLSLNLIHGLRSLLGNDVVDFPKVEHGYRSASQTMRSRAYGRGFTAYFRMDDSEVERDNIWFRAEEGEFDLIIFGDINRTWGMFIENGIPLLGKVPIAIVDGADSPALYPKGPMWWRRRQWWFLPRSHRADFRFKRELGPWTYRTSVYGLIPTAIAKRIGSQSRIAPISFAIPEDNIVESVPEKTKDFPLHIVDPEVAERLGATEKYAFDTEADYYADLRRSRFGITVKRAGWDCMRHYELAASGTIPCFRRLSEKPDTCAPHGLVDGVNCIEYSEADDLFHKLGELDSASEQRLAEAALDWARANTTSHRASELLTACGIEHS